MFPNPLMRRLGIMGHNYLQKNEFRREVTGDGNVVWRNGIVAW